MLKALKRNKPIQPLPFAAYYYTVMCIGFVGLLVSIYLFYSHYRIYTDIGYKSFCAISKAINCDTVSQSTFSIFLGLPVPVWGIIGYVFFLLLLLLAKIKDAQPKRLWSVLFLLSLAFSVYSIILAALSTFYIRSYCIMCLVLYAVNLLLLFYTYIVRSRFESGPLSKGLNADIRFLIGQKSLALALFTPFLVGLILVKLLFPAYWHFAAPVLSVKLNSGITKEGHPWIGAQNPKLTITEFADYQCFQCKKMHFFLRQLIVKYPDKIRLVHRHFPMDHAVNPVIKEPFHMGSGKLALMAIHAAGENKFWQLNDILFERARESEVIDVRQLAVAAGMDPRALARSVNDPAGIKILQDDILAALKFNINGTPAFVINKKVYLAQIPPEIIKTALAD